MIKYLPLALLLGACSPTEDPMEGNVSNVPFAPEIIIDEKPLTEAVIQPVIAPLEESPHLPIAEEEHTVEPIPDTDPDVFLPPPLVDDIIEPEPEVEPEPEILVMAPEQPYVYYRLEEFWEQPDDVRRPVPNTRVYARVDFDDTGADSYNVVRDNAVVQPLSALTTEYEFTFVQPGMAEGIDPTTFPVIQIEALIGETNAISEIAQWVME